MSLTCSRSFPRGVASGGLHLFYVIAFNRISFDYIYIKKNIYIIYILKKKTLFECFFFLEAECFFFFLQKKTNMFLKIHNFFFFFKLHHYSKTKTSWHLWAEHEASLTMPNFYLRAVFFVEGK